MQCAGRYKIVYVAPERLETDRFLEFVMNAGISMITVDEAHCIFPVGTGFQTELSKNCQSDKAISETSRCQCIYGNGNADG